MESQPQNPEFRINPEKFYPWAFHHYLLHTSLGYKMNSFRFQDKYLEKLRHLNM